MVVVLAVFALGMVSLRAAESGRVTFAYACFVLAMAAAASIAVFKE